MASLINTLGVVSVFQLCQLVLYFADRVAQFATDSETAGITSGVSQVVVGLHGHAKWAASSEADMTGSRPGGGGVVSFMHLRCARCYR